MEKNVVEISVTGQRTESMVRDMFTLFTIVQQDMPKVMEHIWKGESKAIQLEDALGRVVDLPFMLCIDQDVWFHADLHPEQTANVSTEFPYYIDTLV